MAETARSLVRVAGGAALLAAAVLGAHIDASDPAQGAILRVAIRTTAGTGRICRQPSEEELAKVPVHMRQKEICETHAVPYQLTVRAGSQMLIDRVYHASGIHGDRPLTVKEDLALAAGRHDVSIRLSPSGALNLADQSAPPEFLYEGTLEFSEGRILLAALEPKSPTFEIHGERRSAP